MKLVGYMRVSKADGSQVLDLQRDALIEAGVERRRFGRTSAAARRMTGPASLHASSHWTRAIFW